MRGALWNRRTTVVAAFGPGADRRGGGLMVETEKVPLRLVDRHHLRRAVCELLDNALAHSPDGSTVDVAVTGSGAAVCICIRDRGCGIDPSDRELLARPFERGGGDRGRFVDGGRGLGLAVAATVAGSHGGRLTLTDRRGGGLVACLELPVDSAPRPTWGPALWQPAAAAWSAGPSGAGGHQGEGPWV